MVPMLPPYDLRPQAPGHHRPDARPSMDPSSYTPPGQRIHRDPRSGSRPSRATTAAVVGPESSPDRRVYFRCARSGGLDTRVEGCEAHIGRAVPSMIPSRRKAELY